MTGDWDTLTENCKTRALEMKFMHNLAKEAKSLRARVTDLMEQSKADELKVWDRSIAIDTEVVAERLARNTLSIQLGLHKLKSDVHELKVKLEVLERCNSFPDRCFFLLVDDCYKLMRQIASGPVCSGEMAKRLAHAQKDVSASIDDFSCYAAHVQTANRCERYLLS